MPTRAGILPIAEYYGSLLVLLGKERKDARTIVYTDFGGGCESGESAQECALRELAEESRGLVQIDFRRTLQVVGREKRVYLVEIEYDSLLPIIFANTRATRAEEAELCGMEWLFLESFLRIPDHFLAHSLLPVKRELIFASY